MRPPRSIRAAATTLAVLALAMAMAGCSSGDGGDRTPTSSPSPVDSDTPSPAATSEIASPTPTETTSPAGTVDSSPTPSASPDPAAAPPVDLLSYGAGAFPIRYDPDSQAELSRTVLDGSPGFRSLVSDPEGPDDPLVLVVELPAVTTFQTFGVPPMSSFGCCSGTHIATVTVEGSATSPDDGYQELVTFDVDAEVFDADQLFDATTTAPVQWVRITLAGRQVPDPEDYRGTQFTELLGYGTQEQRTVGEDEFTGIFLTGGGGSGPDGNRMELIQDGALVTGCAISGGAYSTVSGGVEDGILKLTAPDGVATLAVINSEGQLSGAEIGRSYSRLIGEPGGDPTDCSPQADGPPNPVAEALEAGTVAIVYGINFDVDSDVLRPDAEPALRQVLAALEANAGLAVTIEGHTDSDGSDEHNLDLSQRRAQSVVTWLTDHGIDAGRLTPRGAGEAEPIADNETSAGRAANRRVEVEPGG